MKIITHQYLRKYQIVFLFACLLMVFSPGVYGGIPGDINDDGVIGLSDMALLRDHLLERSPLDADQLSRADANLDGRVDMADLAYLPELYGEVQIRDNVIVVDHVEELTVIDWSEPILILRWSGEAPHNIAIGTYLVGTDFNGFLCRVESISISGDTITLYTTRATLVDVVDSGQPTTAMMPLGPPRFDSDRIRIVTDKYVPMQLGHVEWDLSGLTIYSDNDVTISLPDALFKFEPEFDSLVDLDFDIAPPNIFTGEPARLDYFIAQTGGQFTFLLSGRVDGDIHDTWEEVFAIPGSRYEQTYTIWIKFVPVVIVVGTELVAKANLDTEVSFFVESGFEYKPSFRVGAEYHNNQWRTIAQLPSENPRTWLDWQAEGSLDAKLTISPVIDVMVYWSAGPEFSLDPYLNFLGERYYNPPSYDYSLYCGLDANLKFILRALDHNIVDISFPTLGLYGPQLLLSGSSDPWLGDGRIEIDVTPNSGSWTLSGPSGYSLSGTGDRMGASALTGLSSGSYTLTSHQNISGYQAPPPITRYLSEGGSVRFTPFYTPEVGTGTITIQVSPGTGGWTLSGPQGFSTIHGTGSRIGAGEIRNVPTGSYTLSFWDNVSGYTPPAQQTRTVNAGATASFTGFWQRDGHDVIVLNLPGNVPMELVRIPSGSFVMGSPDNEQDRWSNEGPQRTVNIGYSFYLGKFTVTKAQWEAVMGTRPWAGQSYVLDHPDTPATHVSWNDIRQANGFLDQLNAHLASTGQGWEVRLPSEAEWEYSARAGTSTRFYWGNDPGYTMINNYAWYRGNAWDIGNRYAHIVGQKIPNGWGLYDMSGNVWEWCEDDWHGSYTGAPTDGSPWVDSPRGSNRVNRGGSWLNYARNCRSAIRNSSSTPSNRYYGYGFRALAVRQ